MKKIRTAIVGVSAALLLAPLPLAAYARPHALHFSGHGHGGHHHFFARLHGRHGVNRADSPYGAWPFYGGDAVLPPYAPDTAMTYAPPAQIVYVPEAPQALGCHRSEQTVTVPAEAGGTRQITVQRC